MAKKLDLQSVVQSVFCGVTSKDNNLRICCLQGYEIWDRKKKYVLFVFSSQVHFCDPNKFLPHSTTLSKIDCRLT